MSDTVFIKAYVLDKEPTPAKSIVMISAMPTQDRAKTSALPSPHARRFLPTAFSAGFLKAGTIYRLVVEIPQPAAGRAPSVWKSEAYGVGAEEEKRLVTANGPSVSPQAVKHVPSLSGACALEIGLYGNESMSMIPNACMHMQ
ncbi:hypothetical protein AXG93_4295s1540 [Marchantia polymorpha subsp. ruderalis]|uniref:Uncharacterized protein n=1 Tax=Marchantia polymorpha subsp. ruderalis TaxID=1480154 RepID=A0A176WAK3_MARPO|nr:hypothetical protein AXG93_4295s1540 [Marchantia polymorpha subsp. ruderalis]